MQRGGRHRSTVTGGTVPGLAARWAVAVGAAGRSQRGGGPNRRRGAARAVVAVALGLVLAAGCASGGPPVASRPDPPDTGTTADTVRSSTTTEPSTTTTSSTTTTTAPPPRSFTLAATGDVLAHGAVQDQAHRYGQVSGSGYDFGPMFAAVAPIIAAADLAVCHLETPLAATGPYAGYPAFRVPASMADALAQAGYDTCSTASNHALDAGAAGVAETLDVLDAAGIAHTGTARSDQGTGALLLEVNGVRVAQLSYTYGLNGNRVPPDRPWLVNVLDADRVVADATAARAAGAEVVIASLHWGREYTVEPTAEQRAIAAALAASGVVDVVLGHHAHQIQPVERVDGLFVAFGLGNFLSNQSAACCPAATQDGMVLQLVIQEQPGGRFAVAAATHAPTWVRRGSYVVVPVLDALADPATPAGERAELRRSYDRTVAVVGPDAPAPPPPP